MTLDTGEIVRVHFSSSKVAIGLAQPIFTFPLMSKRKAWSGFGTALVWVSVYQSKQNPNKSYGYWVEV